MSRSPPDAEARAPVCIRRVRPTGRCRDTHSRRRLAVAGSMASAMRVARLPEQAQRLHQRQVLRLVARRTWCRRPPESRAYSGSPRRPHPTRTLHGVPSARPTGGGFPSASSGFPSSSTGRYSSSWFSRRSKYARSEFAYAGPFHMYAGMLELMSYSYTTLTTGTPGSVGVGIGLTPSSANAGSRVPKPPFGVATLLSRTYNCVLQDGVVGAGRLQVRQQQAGVGGAPTRGEHNGVVVGRCSL